MKWKKSIETNFTSISRIAWEAYKLPLKSSQERNQLSIQSVLNIALTKKYAITKARKEIFKLRVSEPIHYKEKNVELVKFFFSGFVDKTKRIE